MKKGKFVVAQDYLTWDGERFSLDGNSASSRRLTKEASLRLDARYRRTLGLQVGHQSVPVISEQK